ncbi:type VII secretion protein EccE [Dactylosporangium sp. CA-052675]|uniref:type VII secretion protein EccE n=1 Tax=Dactylosporangium sp. CA-052675 TaxID=3239927 RepID=UPI003D9013BB
MTQAPASARGSATAPPAGRPDAVDRPRLRRRPGYVGGVHIGRLVLVEAVVLGIAALLPRGPVVAGIAGAVGLAVIVVALLRSHGRWWLERRAMTREHNRRRFAAPDPAHEPDRRLVMLRTLAPGMLVREVPGATADGPKIGIGCDAAGWYAAAVLGTETSMRGDAEPGVPLDLLARVLDEAEHPGAVVQVTTVSVPAPWQRVDNTQFAARSYRELQQLQPGPALPAERTTWVAVRLEARARAEVGMAGSYDAEHAPALVGSLIRKVGRLLRDAGLEHRILTGDELTDALTRACELDPAAPGESWRPQEDWTLWRCGELAHNVFWLKAWPRLDNTSALLEHLISLPSSSSATSLALTRDGGGLALRCLVRVSAPAAALEASARAVTEAAAAAQAELVRLDGEHGPGMYACAPTGGGAK